MTCKISQEKNIKRSYYWRPYQLKGIGDVRAVPYLKRVSLKKFCLSTYTSIYFCEAKRLKYVMKSKYRRSAEEKRSFAFFCQKTRNSSSVHPPAKMAHSFHEIEAFFKTPKSALKAFFRNFDKISRYFFTDDNKWEPIEKTSFFRLWSQPWFLTTLYANCRPCIKKLKKPLLDYISISSYANFYSMPLSSFGGSMYRSSKMVEIRNARKTRLKFPGAYFWQTFTNFS